MATLKEIILQEREKELAKQCPEFERLYGEMISYRIVDTLKKGVACGFYCHPFVTVMSNNSILKKYEPAFLVFCEKQGLKVHEEYNSAGTRLLVVTI